MSRFWRNSKTKKTCNFPNFSAKCHDLFVTGDSEANVITKLQKISFDDIYLKPGNVQATVALDEQIKQLTKRIEQLEKFVVRLGAIARIHTEEQNRPSYRPIWRKNRQNKDNEKTTVATAGASTTKKVVASSNQEGGPQIQHSPVVGGPQLIDSPPRPQILPIFNPRPALYNANLKKIVWSWG